MLPGIQNARRCPHRQGGGDGDSVTYDPKWVEALQQLLPPTSGTDLQRYICAINWMRASIPGFNHSGEGSVGNPGADVRKGLRQDDKQMPSSVLFVNVAWGLTHVAALEESKKAIGCALELSQTNPKMRLCIFADASEAHWGAVTTQVPPDRL